MISFKKNLNYDTHFSKEIESFPVKMYMHEDINSLQIQMLLAKFTVYVCICE
jgi:hypothetical protein